MFMESINNQALLLFLKAVHQQKWLLENIFPIITILDNITRVFDDALPHIRQVQNHKYVIHMRVCETNYSQLFY